MYVCVTCEYVCMTCVYVLLACPQLWNSLANDLGSCRSSTTFESWTAEYRSSTARRSSGMQMCADISDDVEVKVIVA